MTPLRRVGSRAPLIVVIAAALALLLPPTAAFGAQWTDPVRVSSRPNTRLDSMHQLAASAGTLHLVHPRIGPGRVDDRVVYQRSTKDGAKWSSERTLFTSTNQRRHVVPNLAIDARGKIVAVAWRVNGPNEKALFVRVSRDGGGTFGARRKIFGTSRSVGVGVPAVAVGDDYIAVAWTDRSNGKVKLRVSRDGGATFRPTKALGRTSLSIDCKRRVLDGLVGLAPAGRIIHAAWSHASKRACQARSIKVRTSTTRGKKWKPARILTSRRSYGWPELAARGRTIMATVQSPAGGIIVARSTTNGASWSDRLLKPDKGHSLSAADVVLLPEKRAIVTFVNERIKKSRLVGTKVVSRRSVDAGRSFQDPRVVMPTSTKLRMAPNIAALGRRSMIVLQSGSLDGSPRNLFATRLR
jgi:hypothetical protein